MDSSSSRLDDGQRRNADILRQIESLKAQLVEVPSSNTKILDHTPNRTSPKRKQHDSTLLAPPTPSPKKRKLKHTSKPELSVTSRNVLQNLNSVGDSKQLANTRVQSEVHPVKLAPSGVLTKLATLDKQSGAELCPEIVRTTAFVEDTRPSSLLAHEKLDDLEIGPHDHKAPFDDPNFEQLEPNSGIRLASRIISHDDMQDYLRGRYYLSPSRLYSVIRLRPDKQGYDIPVAGDWVTIAVVAERGPVKFSRAPVGIGRDDDGNGLAQGEPNGLPGKGKQAKDSKIKDKQKESTPTPTGKKYVNIKLVDFGARSRSSATGGKAVIRGDAFLTLLLFESDGFDHITREDGGVEKIFRGGSRGAFEAMSKLKEGDIVALLNPKILKPFQRATDTPHPTSNILALTPESASSTVVIGRARDLGMCTVVKRDGKVCGGWCDKRVSDVCEWHVQHAVERQRAGRAEFSIGTSGMSSTSTRKGKPSYDPARQWGLKPLQARIPEGSATYVLSGHIVNGPGSDSSSLYVAETMGREGQAKAKRKLDAKDADRALKALLERDKEGMRAVVKAREFVMQENQEHGRGVKRGKSADRKEDPGREKRAVPASGAELPSSKHSYSAEVIKQLGFDPAVKAGHRRSSDSVIQKKLEALSAVQLTKRDFDLGPRPGRRVRSGVLVPPDVTPTDVESDQILSSASRTVDLDEL